MALPRRDLDPAGAPALTLQALRERGAQQIDPVRFAYIAALARRAAEYQDEARQAIDDRLARAMAALDARCPPAPADGESGSPCPTATTLAEAPQRPGPLGELVAYIDAQVTTPGASTSHASTAPPPASQRRELKALATSRDTWTRLSMARQLSRSLEQVPDNPGPLNSQLLVLRSMRLMQEVSPAYLEHFMSFAETLLWLDQAALSGAAEPGKPLPRNGRKASSTRPKAG